MAFFPRLSGVFFAEFDTIQGPKISLQVPHTLFNSDLFDAISDYIIPKPQLCGRLVSVVLENHIVMGYPVRIENKKYERNGILFNLCFVFGTQSNVASYEPVVRKMASILRTLELESEFVWRGDRGHLELILEQIVDGLNNLHECQIVVDDANSINLKLIPDYEAPGTVDDSMVPVPLVDLQASVKPDWDLTLRTVVPYLDGISFIKKIAERADVALPLVRHSVEHLKYFGLVAVVDVFQFSNVYATTPQLKKLYEDSLLQAECLKHVTQTGSDPPPFHRVFALYCNMRPGVTVADFCLKNDLGQLHVDLRRLIVFGLVHGILYRVHGHAVSTNLESSPLPKVLHRFLNGKYNYDQICTELCTSSAVIQEVLATDTTVYSIWC